MQALRPELDITAFFEHLRRASSSALLLDYDGTLAPFRVDRDQARPYVGVKERLAALCRDPAANHRVIIISGRPCADIVQLLGSDLTIEMWGEHGCERRLRDGSITRNQISAEAKTALEQAADRANKAGWIHSCEIKTSSIALHWRGMAHDQMENLRLNAVDLWQPLTHHTSLMLRPFDGGIELRWGWVNKGDAVQAVIDESPFDSILAYAGDDTTDEDAFAVLDRKGLRILVRAELRDTIADLWLQPPHELLSFLDQWSACTSAKENSQTRRLSQCG